MNTKKTSKKTSKKTLKSFPDRALVIGIESTAHTFGVAIIKGKVILSNEKEAYTTNTGGMIPAKVADHHVEILDEVFKRAIEKAKIIPNQIDLIAFSSSPGLGHSLRIGAAFARALSLKLNKPLVGVNHCIAHLEIGRLITGAKDPILLYASGANTQIIGYESGKYRVFGETLDIGIGNFLDSFGRALGLGFPAGPAIEKLAKKGNKFIDLPYSVKGMDVSFGGILTNIKHKIRQGTYSKEDLCFSVQEIVFSMLIEVTERALAHTGKKEVVLGGGVACNKRLQEMCAIMCQERGAKSFCPENQFLVDNAAMIAWTGLLIFKSHIKDKEENENKKKFTINQSAINPYLRTDDIVINYRC